MKKNVSKLLLAIVCLLSSTNVSAYDFEVDGFYYEVVSASDRTCKVVSNWPQRYAGNIAIPVTFSYDGTIWTVVEIGISAFGNCEDLTSVVIPNSVTTIDKGAFYGCSSLISVTIPNSVITINEGAFGKCTSLTNVTIPNSVTTIGVSVFSGCTSLTNVTISNSIKIISFTLFSGCSSLTSITIPNSVISIDSSAFQGCRSLTSVTIGKSVDRIYDGVFNNCNALTTLYSLNTTPPNVGTNNFTYNQNMNINVYVPQEALSAYRNVEPWKSFKNLQSIEGTGQEMKKCTMPTIHYANNKLTFDCETEGVTFESKITDTDIASYSSNEIKLGVTYNISVYATKAGYEDSDKATATLCWIDVDPKTEGINTDIAPIQANAVLVQAANGQINVTGLSDGTKAANGQINVTGLSDGTKVAVYGIEGTQIGSAISRGGQTSINANITSGSVAIVKIGDRNIKVVMK